MESPCRRNLVRFISLVAFLVLLAPMAVAGERWSLEVGRGSAGDYELRRGGYIRPAVDPINEPRIFQSTSFTTVDLGWPLGKHLSIHATADYAMYAENVPRESPPLFTGTYSNADLKAQFIPISIGLRLSPRVAVPGSIEPFAQLSPALFVLRYSEHAEIWQFDAENQSYLKIGDSTDSFSLLRAGVTGTLGARAPIHDRFYLMGCARLLWAPGSDWEELGGLSSGRFEGPTVAAWTLGFGVRPQAP